MSTPLSRASIAIGDSQFSVWAAMASAVTPLASSRCTRGRIRSPLPRRAGGGGCLLALNGEQWAEREVTRHPDAERNGQHPEQRDRGVRGAVIADVGR